MRIAIIGANGQLGCDLVQALNQEDTIALTHADIEITDQNSVNKIFKEHSPELVINTAAFHNVALCESEELDAFRVNALGAKNLAQACLKYHSILAHISTDYVFDGRQNIPYKEEDAPNPINIYGISKLAGEYCIRSIIDKHFIIRTSGLYGTYKCRGKYEGFIDRILRLYKEKKEIKLVNDKMLSFTYCLDLAQQIRKLIKTEHFGTYHIVNQGACSWFEFAKELFKLLNYKVDIIPMKLEEFQDQVKRPIYSVLDNHKLNDLGIDNIRNWQEALREYSKNIN